MTYIRVANRSAFPFGGVLRTTIDGPRPTWQALLVGDVVIQLGRQCGRDTHAVDVLCSLAPNEERVLNLSSGVSVSPEPVPVPENPLDFFGGPLTVGGIPASWVSLVVDGSALRAHLRVRTGLALVTDIDLLWYPRLAGYVRGEATVTCSNPNVDALHETLQEPLRLAFGDGAVLVLGAADPHVLIPGGTTFADGQARILPFTVVFPRHISPEAFSTIGSLAQGQIGASGISRLLTQGTPRLDVGFDRREFARLHTTLAVPRLHTWSPATLGPAPNSTVTGRQEDQVFVRGEFVAGAGLELAAYYAALKMANRPCHHREADGGLLRLAERPGLVLWDGRAHWHTGVSPDRLGKTSNLSIEQASGWWGPDVEHHLCNTLAAAVRLTGSPALQRELANQALIYMGQMTTKPGLSTTQMYASRALGWEGINVRHFLRELEDRELAARVYAHAQKRLSDVILPQLRKQRADYPTGWFMDVRKDDPRLGTGEWWIPWQQAVGAYGLMELGEELGSAEAQGWAFNAATQVVDRCYRENGNRWHSCPTQSVAGTEGAFGTDFLFFGMAMAPAVVLRVAPQHPKARSIWNFLQNEATDDADVAWLAPGVSV